MYTPGATAIRCAIVPSVNSNCTNFTPTIFIEISFAASTPSSKRVVHVAGCINHFQGTGRPKEIRAPINFIYGTSFGRNCLPVVTILLMIIMIRLNEERINV